MLVTVHNEALTVQIEDAGAQLASIRDTRGVEYLWQGDPAIWNRRAPLLFPFIARLKDEQYLLDGKPYTWASTAFAAPRRSRWRRRARRA